MGLCFAEIGNGWGLCAPIGVFAGCITGGAFLLIIFTVLCILKFHICENHHDKTIPQGDGTISYDEIIQATAQFTSTILGRGGFGPVYSGHWRGHTVAIKVLDPTGLQGRQEFLREIGVLERYQHQHLVPLLAYNDSLNTPRRSAYLVYPLMAESLETALATRSAQLPAATRLLIASDVAAGLQYMHEPNNNLPPIIHRDVKSSNVLLDTQCRARISDLGLSRSAALHGVTMTHGVGTLGYMDPEYIETGKSILLVKLSSIRFSCCLCHVCQSSIFSKSENLNKVPNRWISLPHFKGCNAIVSLVLLTMVDDCRKVHLRLRHIFCWGSVPGAAYRPSCI